MVLISHDYSPEYSTTELHPCKTKATPVSDLQHDAHHHNIFNRPLCRQQPQQPSSRSKLATSMVLDRTLRFYIYRERCKLPSFCGAAKQQCRQEISTSPPKELVLFQEKGKERLGFLTTEFAKRCFCYVEGRGLGIWGCSVDGAESHLPSREN